MNITYMTVRVHMPYLGLVILESNQKKNNRGKEPRKVRNTYKYVENKKIKIIYA